MNNLKLVVLFLALNLLSGCASNVSNSQINFQSSGEKLNLGELKKHPSSLYVLFDLSKTKITVTEVKHSLNRYEGIDIDRANQKLDFDNGDSLKGCIEIVKSKDYKYCSMEVFRETNIDMAGVIVGSILYPIAILSIASGNADKMFTQTDIDSKAVYKIGAYLESELAKRRAEIKQALINHNSAHLQSDQEYFLTLANKQEVERAISSVKNPTQLQQTKNILARLKSNEKVISTAKLNVRESASPRAKIVGKLTAGKIVTPKVAKNGWYQVQDGWVSAKYAKDIKDGYLTKLTLRGNKINFANQSQTLLANKQVSSQDVSKVLNNKALLQGVSSDKIAKLKALKNQAIERERFAKATSKNTVAAFDEFLSDYPIGEYATQAIALREPLWFAQAKKQHNAMAYRKFLNAYPKSQYYLQVRDLWLAMASQQNTALAYKDFIKGYEVTSQENQAFSGWFELVKQQHSIAGYRDFLKSAASPTLVKQATNLLEPLWFKRIASTGVYFELSGFLIDLPHSTHVTSISYAHNNCTRIANDFFITRDACVVNYLKLDDIRKQKTFRNYAKAYALSGQESDFNLAQKLASGRSEKQIIEYFAVLALTNKSRLFDVEIRDQHQFLGSSDHATWFAQAKGTSEAKIKGKLTLALKDDAPFELRYGSYEVKTKLNLKAYYAKEVRSSWVGSSNTNPVETEAVDVAFQISDKQKSQTKAYDFGTYTIAYKDTGMMGGYTASYLEREIEFSTLIHSITPTQRLSVF
jgi:hypothetical protein